LSIRLVKREEAKPKQIKVNIGQGQSAIEGKKDAVSTGKSSGQAA